MSSTDTQNTDTGTPPANPPPSAPTAEPAEKLVSQSLYDQRVTELEELKKKFDSFQKEVYEKERQKLLDTLKTLDEELFEEYKEADNHDLELLIKVNQKKKDINDSKPPKRNVDGQMTTKKVKGIEYYDFDKKTWVKK